MGAGGDELSCVQAAFGGTVSCHHWLVICVVADAHDNPSQAAASLQCNDDQA